MKLCKLIDRLDPYVVFEVHSNLYDIKGIASKAGLRDFKNEVPYGMLQAKVENIKNKKLEDGTLILSIDIESKLVRISKSKHIYKEVYTDI